ncbi:MAG: MGMT family protein [Patescibacteria group bacterium]|jgi:O-6-methylguanine DNA methyltransferase
MLKTFTQKVRAVVARIPRGEVRSYGEVAKLAGNKNGARAVGSIMRANHDPNFPCHRVICSNGKVGGFNLGKEEKIRKLRSEGAKISGDKII